MIFTFNNKAIMRSVKEPPDFLMLVDNSKKSKNKYEYTHAAEVMCYLLLLMPKNIKFNNNQILLQPPK